MEELSYILSGQGGDQITLARALPALMLAFVLSQVVAAVYTWTFRGMSYSRAYVQTVAVGSIVAAMLMLALNNSIAAALGIAGSLAFIRFRTAVRDPRDMIFVFASMGAGIACGLEAYAPAVAGTAVFSLGMILTTYTELGSQRRYDGLLRFQLPTDADQGLTIGNILKTHTTRFALVTLREVAQGSSLEHAYQVRLDDDARRVELVRALEALPGIRDVTLYMQDQTVEL